MKKYKLKHNIKEYKAHLNTKFKSYQNKLHSHYLKLSFVDWANLYAADKAHWVDVERYDKNLNCIIHNPIYSKASWSESGFYIQYEDFCIYFKSVNDYNAYINFIEDNNACNATVLALLNNLIHKSDSTSQNAIEMRAYELVE